MEFEKKKKIIIFSVLGLITVSILFYFFYTPEKTEKEKYAELKKEIEHYYTLECDSLYKVINADSILTSSCIKFLDEYPKSIHFQEIKSLLGKNLDYKVGDCLKENMRKFLYSHRFDYLNQSVVLTVHDTAIIKEIDSILKQKQELEKYYDKKVYDIIDLENQLNYKKSSCLFPYEWIQVKETLFEKLKKNALESAYNSLSVMEKAKNDLDEIENVIYQEDSTVKLIFTPSQERIVQYDLVYAVKLKVLPSSKKDKNDDGFLGKIIRFFNDVPSLITGDLSTTVKLVKVSGYMIGRVSQDDASTDIKQNLLYDSCRILN